MSLGPLQLAAPPKPRMSLDEHRNLALQAKDRLAQTKQVMDAFQNAAARTGIGTSNLIEGSSYPFNRITLNYILLTSLYRGNWIIRKIVDAIADDCFKNWLTITSELEPKKIDRFKREGIDATGTQAKLTQAMKWGRLYGGAGAVIIIKGDDNFKRPLDVEDVELDSYKGLLVFDRWSGISPGLGVSSDVNDPLNFGLPEFYEISTENAKRYQVHHSRVLRFTGPELPNWEWQANMRWGASVVEAMFEELKKRDNTSWNIASLIFRANIMELNSPQLENMLSGLGSNAEAANRFYQSISALTQLMSNQGLVVTGNKQSMSSHSYGFAGISDVYVQFMLDICGATEYPMSRLFGRSSSGLSGTNEGDEHNYYDLCKQRQATEINPGLRQLFPVIAMSTWGKVPKDFDWYWNPVNTLPDKERIEMAGAATTAIVEVYNTGAISQKTMLQELNEQSDRTGVFTNITSDLIEKADDATMSTTEMASMGGEETAPGESDSFSGEPKAAKGTKGKKTSKTEDALEEKKRKAAEVLDAIESSLRCNKRDDALKLEAENWNVQGFKVNIENLRGSVRHGRNFHQAMTAPYGYIQQTEGTDGDAVDCFVGPVLDASYIYVVHTKDPVTSEYDEDKCFLGFESARSAHECFLENYSDPAFFDSMEKFTTADFRKMLVSLRGRKITATYDEFVESEHPRVSSGAHGGEFTKGGGGSSSSASSSSSSVSSGAAESKKSLSAVEVKKKMYEYGHHKIFASYEAGKSTGAIAKEMGLEQDKTTRSTIRALLRKQGLYKEKAPQAEPETALAVPEQPKSKIRQAAEQYAKTLGPPPQGSWNINSKALTVIKNYYISLGIKNGVEATNVVSGWTGSSHSKGGQILKAVACKVYGKPLEQEPKITLDPATVKSEADKITDAVVAQKEFTGAWVKEFGAKKVYRGLKGKVVDEIKQQIAAGKTEIEITANALSSWSTDKKKATGFAGDGHMSGVVLQMPVNPDHVWACYEAQPFAFSGFMSEKEYVMGLPGKTLKIKKDDIMFVGN